MAAFFRWRRGKRDCEAITSAPGPSWTQYRSPGESCPDQDHGHYHRRAPPYREVRLGLPSCLEACFCLTGWCQPSTESRRVHCTRTNAQKQIVTQQRLVLPAAPQHHCLWPPPAQRDVHRLETIMCPWQLLQQSAVCRPQPFDCKGARPLWQKHHTLNSCQSRLPRPGLPWTAWLCGSTSVHTLPALRVQPRPSLSPAAGARATRLC